MREDYGYGPTPVGADPARDLAFGPPPPTSAAAAYLAAIWLMVRGVPDGGDSVGADTPADCRRVAEAFAALDWLRRSAEAAAAVKPLEPAEVLAWASSRYWHPNEKRRLIRVIEEGLEL